MFLCFYDQPLLITVLLKSSNSFHKLEEVSPAPISILQSMVFKVVDGRRGGEGRRRKTCFIPSSFTQEPVLEEEVGDRSTNKKGILYILF